ncbi:hypothetical protein KBD81_05300 [Candidatus Woesebacteria bacterium]|nr:hypothetical protein [Candidatus Woesebacteria bacterium]
MLTQEDTETILDIVQREVNSSKKELKNDILQFKDDILTEILHLRDDIAVITGYRSRIEEHEERIDELEKHVYSSR